MPMVFVSELRTPRLATQDSDDVRDLQSANHRGYRGSQRKLLIEEIELRNADTTDTR